VGVVIRAQRPLELLRPPTGRCLGAAFSTYTFDEHFFESVLASLLPIHADPESDTRMFLAEARRRLRETPVIVLADGSNYGGGHRLPFDLILSARTVAFHARWSLLLFQEHARLIVGSANLTWVGSGESADLSAVLDLDYGRDAGAIAHAVEVLETSGAQGEGWDRLQKQVQMMLGPKTSAPAPPLPRLLVSSPDKPVLKQFLAAIPKTGRIDAVHWMTPTQPQDDARFGTKITTALRSWLRRRAKSATLNIALSWVDAEVHAPASRARTEPEQLPGFLCAEVEGPPGAETVRWTAAERFVGNKLSLHGRAPLPRQAVATVMHADPPRFWAAEEVTGACLLQAFEPFTESAKTRWWLYPEVQLSHGQYRKRPFHARVLAVCVNERQGPFTHLLVGAPSFDRASGKDARAFEVGLHLRVPGALKITDLCPELVPAPDEGFSLVDSAWPASEPRDTAPLDGATYDARSRTLVLDWRPRAPRCVVTYQREASEDVIVNGQPVLRTQLSEFALAPTSTELHVAWDEKEALVPITVKSLPYLRADEPEDELTLQEMVMRIAHQGRATEPGPVLHAQEVFQAQQALVGELASTGPLLGAFEVVMDGPLGLRVFGERLLQAKDCDPTEAWIYGLELCRLLRAVAWAKDPIGRHKQQQLEVFLQKLEARLKELVPEKPWSQDVAKFYGRRA
jgi:hypothetical protein